MAVKSKKRSVRISARQKRELTPAQKQEKADRKAKLDALIKKVSEMTPEQREALITKCGGIINCEGRRYSDWNTCFVLNQNEQATVVGGFQQWIQRGRVVKKGEQGIAILVPMKGEEGDDPDEA